MSKTNERHNGSFGRQILDQLSEQLAKSKKRARGEQLGEEERVSGAVYKLNDCVDSTDLGDDFYCSRRFSSQELQLLILVLLADQPAQGVELITNFETLSKGFYTPSPDMVYPALTYLDELGYVTVLANGNHKSYSLSNVGKQYLANHHECVNELWLALTNATYRVGSIVSDTLQQSKADERPAWIPELTQAQQTLKNALAQCNNVTTLEQQRITEILLQAARAILNK